MNTQEVPGHDHHTNRVRETGSGSHGPILRSVPTNRLSQHLDRSSGSRQRQPILGLLAVAIAFEVLVFVLPMVSIHRAMRTQKAELVARADGLSRTISALQATLCETTSSEERQATKDRIADLTEEYWRIQRTPTWPVDPSLRRRFGLNNLALVLPFLGQAVGETGVWSQIAELLRDLGSG